MTLELGNGRKFFAYHIRSAHLTFEAMIESFLDDKGVSKAGFYVLRCDWRSPETPFEELAAHAILSPDEAKQAIRDLMAKDYVSEGKQGGFYALTPGGASLREKLLSEYRSRITEATAGVTDEAIEVALSTLLRLQNNFQQN